MASPQPCRLTRPPDFKPPDDHAQRFDRAAAGIQESRQLREFLTCQVDDGVEHVRAGVEEETTARRSVGILAPGTDRARSPVLPDGGADGDQPAEFSAVQQSDAALRIWGDRLPGKATTSSFPVRSRSRSGRVPRRHSSPSVFRAAHPAGFQAELWSARKWIGMRGDDEGRVEWIFCKAARSGPVGWAEGVSPASANICRGGFVLFSGGLAHHGISVVSLV